MSSPYNYLISNLFSTSPPKEIDWSKEYEKNLLFKLVTNEEKIPKDIVEALTYKVFGLGDLYNKKLEGQPQQSLMDRMLSHASDVVDKVFKNYSPTTYTATAIPDLRHLTPVALNYQPKSMPIDFNQFRADMETKWRYQHGDPRAREALAMSQADYYRALASLGIPSEAALRLVTASLGIPSEAMYRAMLSSVGIPSQAEANRAQAEYYRAMARQGIPAEAVSKYGLANYYGAMSSIGIPAQANAQNALAGYYNAMSNYYNTLAASSGVPSDLMGAVISSITHSGTGGASGTGPVSTSRIVTPQEVGPRPAGITVTNTGAAADRYVFPDTEE